MARAEDVMLVKGTSLIATLGFVRQAFGEPGVQRWLGALGEEARAIYQGAILPVAWYPLATTFATATAAVCTTFFAGDMSKAVEVGRYSADQSLRGLYRLFVRVGTPHFLVSRTARVFATYYQDAELSVVEERPRGATAVLRRFPGINAAVEWRFSGYFARALEISGCRDVQVSMPSMMSKGQADTMYLVSWS